MAEKRLKTVDRAEDIVVIFDNKLSFEEHINSTVKKLTLSQVCYGGLM